MTDLATQLNEALSERYAIRGEVGSGGMAIVFLADDLKHERRVAIKALRPQLAAALGPERFLREIKTTAQLAHPHILTMHDSGEADGILYYVMPYAEGESLRERVDREKQLPLDDALLIAGEVADALGYAHSRGIVHRDIKPENILLTAGHASVADFGIARAVDLAGGERLTGIGLALGTPHYMSPEQAACSPDIDARADVYSLGCVLYEMLVGAPPFTGATVDALLHQHLTEDPPDVTVTRARVPPEVAGVVSRALAKTPADRFTTGGQFADAIRATAQAKPVESAKSRTPKWAAGVLAGVIAVALVTLFALQSTRSPMTTDARETFMAIIPFAPASEDTVLSRVGRELAIMLAANLDGVGEITTANALAVLAQPEIERGLITLNDAGSIGARLNAKRVLHGSIVRAGNDIRLDYGLYPTGDGTPIARGSIVAPGADIAMLTDSTTWDLLRQIWNSEEPPTPSLAAIQTASIPALRAFLDGEQLFARGQIRNAATAYGRAIDADSTFWFAYWRYYYSRAYHGQRVPRHITDAMMAHRSEFPEPDRALLESRMADSLSDRIEQARTIAQRYRDYWPAQFDYADLLIHSAPFLGYTLAESRPVLDRISSLQPNFVTGWGHAFWLGIYNPDTAYSGRALRALVRLGADSTSLADAGLNELDLDRYLLHLAASDGRVSDSLSAAMAGQGAQYRGVVPYASMVRELSDYGFHAANIHLTQQTLALQPTDGLAEAIHWGLPMMWAGRGGWDSTVVLSETFAQRTGAPESQLYAYRLATLGFWLDAIDESAAVKRRAVVESVAARLSPPQRAELAWLDGLRAATNGDAGALRQARTATRDADSVTGRFLERSLAAFELELDGRIAEAGAAMAELERERAQTGWTRGRSTRHPALTGVNRLAASRWLLAAADTTTAASLLTWHEAVLPESVPGFYNAIFAAYSFLDRARIEEARGRPALATEYYDQFLRRYDAAVSAHQPLVNEARTALVRLREMN